MKVSIEWLNALTPILVDEKQFCDGMTMSGTKVESCEVYGKDIQQVVTGRITEISEHPDADKLIICKVDIGGETLQIVTGASNVQVGHVVPIACNGASLPGGLKIKTGKLRGQLSEGMMCSIDELDLTEADWPGADANGILILPDDTPLGQNILETLHLDDQVIDFEVTSNRVDCFSVEGLAREAAVTFDMPFNPVAATVRADSSRTTESLSTVNNMAPELCNRYCARIVEHVKIEPSPEWMRRRLRCAGVRPINNIVDITNYVMLELGQPMHAFDLNDLAGREINIRRAGEGEVIKTLDDTERKLDETMLVIADSDRAVALAGVMGAENTEIKPTTQTILFEAATFNAQSVRQTAKKVGLRTESSSRFDKGLDSTNAGRAIERACELVELLGAGDVCQGMIDSWPVKPETRTITFSPDAINAFLGTQIARDWMLETLEKIGLGIIGEGQMLSARVPTYRPDLESEADLAEEAARFYGYNRIKPSLLSNAQTTLGGRSRHQKTIEKIKDKMTAQGYYEACTYSFESPRQMDKMNLEPDHDLRRAVVIQNPLGEDFSVMRTSMIPSLLNVAAINWKRSVDVAKVFEIGYVYQAKSLPLTDLPTEIRHLAAFCYDDTATDQGGGAFFALKGECDELFRHLAVRSVEYLPLTDCPYLHPGQAASLVIDGEIIGQIGRIHPDVAGDFECSAQTVLLDLELDKIVDNIHEDRLFKALPRYPAVMRDLAILVDSNVLSADLLKTMQEAAGPILETIEVFDVYQGPQVPKNMKSVAYSLVFRSLERTLKEEDIQPAVKRILKKLKHVYGASLRE